jgi:CRISPR-associated protein Csb2
MIAFAFNFPVGRYHATPWGRHANEADVAWPPEPVRILRALIATWWRKADHARFPKAVLDDLIDALALELPVFHLPQAVHTHVRAYMPAPSDRKLIYDAFLRLDRDAELIVAWRGVAFGPEQKELCSHLLERIGYIGRAESWTCARMADNWNGKFNSFAREPGQVPIGDIPVEVAVSLGPTGWAQLRTQLLQGTSGTRTAKRVAMEVTLPERLSDALSVDTGDWQRAGWSDPPPLRRVVYDRQPIGPLPSSRSWRRPSIHTEPPGRPEVARFVLAGRPQPRVEEALRIGELTRAALMSGGGDPPPEFSGRAANGPQRDDPAHAHAFFLPEDADGDGLIDHLIVYCRRGFSREARRRLDRLTRLWLAHGRVDEEGERGRKEWRVALEDIAAPQAFGKVSPLLRHSRVWSSVTPYLMPWHAKRDFGAAEQISREILCRGTLAALTDVTLLDQKAVSKRAIRFLRMRSRKGLVQPDRVGCFLSLTFAESIPGPLAFGFGCHYGLGSFGAGVADMDEA